MVAGGRDNRSKPSPHPFYGRSLTIGPTAAMGVGLPWSIRSFLLFGASELV